MKHLLDYAYCHYIFAIAVMGLIALFMCCNNELYYHPTELDPASRLQINSVTSKDQTRSVKSAFQEGDKISLTIMGENSYQYDENEEDDETYYKYRTAIYTAGKWVLDQDVYLSDKNACIYSHYPVARDFKLSTDRQEDILVGRQKETVVNSATPAVNLVMSHAMALLQFKMRKEELIGAGVVGSIRMSDTDSSNPYIATEAVWDFSTEKITHTSNNPVVLEKAGGLLTLEESFSSNPLQLYIIPTLKPTLEDGDIVFHFTVDGKPYMWRVPGGMEYKSGYIYEYNVTINSVGLQVGDVEITPWEMGGGSADITITN